ncbi:MAG: MAPEG family protein [Rubricella sp.]
MNPDLSAVALYTGLNTLILIALSIHVGRVRSQEKVFMGDGGNRRVIRAMRGQANFVEHAPLALLILLVMALSAAPAWAIHVLGIMLTAGRAMHAAHFIADDAPVWQRAGGALLTLLVLLIGGAGLILHALV